MKRASIFVLGLLFSTMSYAIPAPYYFSVNVIDTILQDERVVEALGVMDEVVSVERRDARNVDDLRMYQVKTERCTLAVQVKFLPLPEGMVGSPEIELTLGKLNCSK